MIYFTILTIIALVVTYFLYKGLSAVERQDAEAKAKAKEEGRKFPDPQKNVTSADSLTDASRFGGIDLPPDH